MSIRRATFAFLVVVYVFLWFLAAHGARQLVAPLTVPLVLAALVAAGIALDRFIGITPRRPKFKDDDHGDA